MRLSEHPGGIEIGEGRHVVYDVSAGRAFLGAVAVNGPAILWELDDPGAGHVVRCDRVDFPPGGIAYRHVHPAQGVRRILHGELTIDRSDGYPQTYRAGESWHEGADDPVLATASATEDTAFVRVMVLPAEWAGKRTIRYVDPADEDRPRLQRATVLLEEQL
ncbi:MAG TPA: cupin domain-containing protein [Gaiellaceae bacterium]|nr:cupin domain-containing protein [Gaiellaceae bacterium]